MIGGGGIIYYSIEKFGRPFSRAEERSFSVPEDGYVRVSSDKFKIVYILDGQSIHEVKHLENNRIATGDILIAPHNIVQYYRPLPEEKGARIHAFLLFFDPKYLPLLPEDHDSYPVARSPERSFTDFVRHHLGKVLLLADSQTPQIRELIHQIRKEAQEKPFGYRHRVHALCQDLVICTARVTGQFRHSSTPQSISPSTPQPIRNDIVESAKEYIFRHLSEEMTLGQIAWNQRKSEEHLARVFKAVTGQTVFEYIREARLEQAKIYLRDTRRTLTQIAELTGFSSLSYFSRSFQSYLGISPSQYRKEMTIDQASISRERRRIQG